MESTDIAKKAIEGIHDQINETVADAVCNIVDEAVKGIRLEFRISAKGRPVLAAFHGVKDSATYGEPFAEFDLERILTENETDEDQTELLPGEIHKRANALEDLAEELRAYA